MNFNNGSESNKSLLEPLISTTNSTSDSFKCSRNTKEAVCSSLQVSSSSLFDAVGTSREEAEKGELLCSNGHNNCINGGGGGNGNGDINDCSNNRQLTRRQEQRRRRRHNNKNNIRLTMYYTIFAFSGRSLWNVSVLPTYVYLIRNNDAISVGVITAVTGLSQLIVSFPTGVLTDSKYLLGRRHILLKAASIIGIVAIVCTIISLQVFSSSYTFLVASLALWGVLWGIVNTSLNALFADSITTKHDCNEEEEEFQEEETNTNNNKGRSYHFTQRSQLIYIGNSLGPATTLLLFWILGDKWTVNDCSIVMVIGQIICLPSIIILCFFRDNKTNVPVDSTITIDTRNGLDDDNNTNGYNCRDNDDNEGDVDQHHHQLDREQEPFIVIDDNDIEDDRDSSNDNINSTGCDDSNHRGGNTDQQRCFCCTKSRSNSSGCSRVIPILVASADVMAGISAGMSIRYFPIFFVKHLHLSPIAVQVLYIIAPLCQVILAQIAQHTLETLQRVCTTDASSTSNVNADAANNTEEDNYNNTNNNSSSGNAFRESNHNNVMIGKERRCHIIVTYKWIGILCMALMILSYDVFHLPIYVTIILYVIRTSFMNSTRALSKSLLMDSVPSNERGIWSSLESVNMFSWSGSAAIGSLLVNYKGIIFNFVITLVLQFIATIPFIVLIFKYDSYYKLQHPSNRVTTTITS